MSSYAEAKATEDFLADDPGGADAEAISYSRVRGLGAQSFS